jgi:hypothetical protein
MDLLSLAASLIKKVLSNCGCKRRAEDDLRPEAKRRKFNYQIPITGSTGLSGLERPAEVQVIRSHEDILSSYWELSSTPDTKELRAKLDSLERVTAIAKARLEALETSRSDSAIQAELQAETKRQVDEMTSADDQEVLE